jgi:hypothetical protein
MGGKNSRTLLDTLQNKRGDYKGIKHSPSFVNSKVTKIETGYRLKIERIVKLTTIIKKYRPNGRRNQTVKETSGHQFSENNVKKKRLFIFIKN